MDPCTQGLIGATFSSLFSNKKDIRKASLCGAIGGLAPDLDIFIRSENGLGEGILLTCQYDNESYESSTVGPFPLDFFS